MASERLSNFENDSPGDSSAEDPGERGILRHLLGVESEAAVLVDDAQAEADRRVAEGEKESRSRYDEGHSREAERLDGDYAKAVLEIKEDYRKQLEAYREGLADTPVRQDAFSALIERLLFEEP
jgi:regulator of protease activity HflC (stomatin/prohibitin superfamily)